MFKKYMLDEGWACGWVELKDGIVIACAPCFTKKLLGIKLTTSQHDRLFILDEQGIKAVIEVLKLINSERVAVCATVYISDPISLSKAKALVGGYITLIPLLDEKQMLVDDDGIRKKLPINKEASAIADTTILGNAIILTGNARW